jgi:hypothetical protein
MIKCVDHPDPKKIIYISRELASRLVLVCRDTVDDADDVDNADDDADDANDLPADDAEDANEDVVENERFFYSFEFDHPVLRKEKHKIDLPCGSTTPLSEIIERFNKVIQGDKLVELAPSCAVRLSFIPRVYMIRDETVFLRVRLEHISFTKINFKKADVSELANRVNELYEECNGVVTNFVAAKTLLPNDVASLISKLTL